MRPHRSTKDAVTPDAASELLAAARRARAAHARLTPKYQGRPSAESVTEATLRARAEVAEDVERLRADRPDRPAPDVDEVMRRLGELYPGGKPKPKPKPPPSPPPPPRVDVDEALRTVAKLAADPKVKPRRERRGDRFVVRSVTGYSGNSPKGLATIWQVQDRADLWHVVFVPEPSSHSTGSGEARERRARLLAAELNQRDPRPFPMAGAAADAEAGPPLGEVSDRPASDDEVAA